MITALAILGIIGSVSVGLAVTFSGEGEDSATALFSIIALVSLIVVVSISITYLVESHHEELTPAAPAACCSCAEVAS